MKESVERDLAVSESLREMANDRIKELEPLQFVYVVGIPEGGGCYLSSPRVYSSYEQCEKKLMRDRAQGINYTVIFTLEIQQPDS